MAPVHQRAGTALKRGIRAAQRRALEPVSRQQRALLQTTQLSLALRYREHAARGGPLPSYRDVGFGVELGSESWDASNGSNLILHHHWSGRGRCTSASASSRRR
jgi:hypothetical protein